MESKREAFGQNDFVPASLRRFARREPV